MKKSTLTLTIICAIGALGALSLSYAGPESKEVMQQAPPPCDWYRAHEWDFDLWGTVAFPINQGHNDDVGNDFTGDVEPVAPRLTATRDIGQISNDRFLNRDNVWGGGLDVKYFVSKYWGFGAEGMVLAAKYNTGGAGLVTFDLRYPIGCSRFAPYAWAGVGAAGGGSHTIALFVDQHPVGGEIGEEEEVEKKTYQKVENKKALAIGQFGGGLEIRITRHIGLMGDVSYNVLQDGDNDFWMTRFGVTLSY